MAAERRAYKRHPIHWDVEVSGKGFGPLAFVVTDFCEGGLFLEPEARAADEGLRRHLRQSDWIQVSLNDPVSGARRDVHSRVARTSDRGFGVAFHTPQTGVFSALLTVAAGSQSARNHELTTGQATHARSDRTVADGQTHLAACRTPISEYLTKGLSTFTSQAETILLRSAESSADDQSQSRLLTALDALNSHRGRFTGDFRQRVLDGWDRLGHFSINPETPEASDPDQLSLVDDKDFDDWLGRSDIITRAESRTIGTLRMLHLRLSELAGTAVDDYRNPVSPAALCHLLSQQFDSLNLPHDARLALYPVFGRTVLESLTTLYEDLNRQLGNAGVLPGLENERLPSRTLPSEEAGKDNARQGRGRDAHKPASDAAASVSASRRTSGGGQGGGRPAASRGVRDLFRAQRGRHHPEASAAPDGQPPVPAAALLRAGEILRKGPEDAGLPLSTRLKQALAKAYPDNPPQLNSEQTETVELLDQWFAELRNDMEEQPFFSHWTQRIKPLALEEELRSGAILENRDHAVNRILNALDLAAEIMAVSNETDRESLRQQLNPPLEQAIEEFDGDPESLAGAASRLEALLQRPQRTLEAGMERVRQTCEGAQRLELARRTVDQALSKRLGGKAIPEPVMRLLEQGWRNYLVLVELRQGTDSKPWTRGLRVPEVLAAGIGSRDITRRLPREPDKVLAYVEGQLLATNRPREEVTALMEDISRWVKRPPDSAEQPPSMVFQGTVESPSQPDLPQEWLGQAKLLRIGDWIQLRDDNGRKQQLRLAWISRDEDRFVFVGRDGKKAADLTLEALATQLGSHQADADTDFNAPVTERRWQEMLVRLNRQLVHSATHDPLTGLLNRYAFQRQIKALLDRADGTREHVLIHLALDDFKVVNNSLGHDGGDRALRQVGELLVDNGGKSAVVSRIGGDEFGVLLINSDAQAGMALSERLLESLGQHRFTVDDRTVKIAASIGVVPFSRQSHGIEDLLKDSDGASFTAKKQGGNRVHVYKPGDAEMEKLRESLSQASRIDEALDGGLLTLRCQRIEPLQRRGSRPLYEVLISVTGADQYNMRPDTFIPAAERFGRMPALDRWVISEVFQWASRNQDRLREVDALSINLSGQSLSDPGFLEFLKEQFRDSGVPPGKICLEVTETAAVANLAMAADLIRELKQTGCRFALDDFGSGLSSYSYLKNLPTDFLKIDGEFIRDLNREDADDAMVRSIHELSHHLGKLTVAEYVETGALRELLADMGMDFGQGYAIERPIPLDELGGASRALP